MATFTDCSDNLTCATLSGSNGVGVGLVPGTPNKIVVSASNVPNSALQNSSININGTTITLGATGSLAIGDITAVTAGTNLTGGGTSGSVTVSLTSSITSGLTNISNLTSLGAQYIDLSRSAGIAFIEMGGPTGAHIDLKNPFSDDYDLRIKSWGTEGGGEIRNWDGASIVLSGTNVGIGTFGPSAKLHIHTDTGNDGLYLSGTSNLWSSFRINMGNGSYNNIVSASDRGIIYGGASSGNPGGGFVIAPWATGPSGLKVDSIGNVGIGTTNPSAKLEISGNTIISDNSANAALRITQVGSGEALRVEDSANPDSTPFVVDASGNVGIGISPSSGIKLHVATDTNTWIRSQAANGIPLFNCNRSNGTNASPTPVANGDELGRFDVRGYNNGTFQQAAQISAVCTTTPGGSDTAIATALYFKTSPGGTTAPADRMIINSAGNVGIGTTTPDNYKLDVAGSGRFTSNVEITGTLKGLTQLSSSAISASTYIGLPSSTATITVYEEATSLGSSFTGVRFKGLGITAVANGATADVTVAQAGAAQEGVVSTGTQTFAGNKTFSGDVNIQGNTTIGNATTDTITMTATTMSLNTVLSVDAGTLYIDGTNNRVYAGGTSGSANLHVYGTASTAAGSVFRVDGYTGNDNVQGNIVKLRNTRALARTSMEFQDYDGSKAVTFGFGNTGVGSNIPYEGNAYLELENYANNFSIVNNGTLAFYVEPGGFVSASSLELSSDSAAKLSTNTWQVTSDIRVKENITNYSKGLETINLLNPVVFDYNGKGKTKKIQNNIGLIAQEVKDILPESVSTYKAKLNSDDTEDTELYNFNSHALTYVLINSVKQLKQENDVLKNTLNDVLARLSALENK